MERIGSPLFAPIHVAEHRRVLGGSLFPSFQPSGPSDPLSRDRSIFGPNGGNGIGPDSVLDL